MFENETPSLSKRDRTRSAIRAVAIRSLREQGYDATTMRGIAAEAGLSVGNAYYHFPTKDHLVQELYVDVQQEHRALALPLLADEDDLTARIGIVVRTGLANLTEYHAIAPQFLAAAFTPDSPVNPLSSESTPARDLVLGLFTEAVSGAKQQLPRDLAEDLPTALWMGYLLLALFWTYDRSPDQTRTTKLVDAMLRVLRFALPLLRVRPFRLAVTEIVGIVAGRVS
jgi:AcrR family transcriptional regulator